ncbi:MAG: hypothetical protein JO137_00035, partial [Hyphomicrobiales bacterium]|nr:hypothetical protein [Hyphomicrobiales bacterium]
MGCRDTPHDRKAQARAFHDAVSSVGRPYSQLHGHDISEGIHLPTASGVSISSDKQLSIDQALALAVEHFRGERLAQAEALCQKILAAAPGHAPTLHLYGIIAYRAGALPVAINLLRRAIAADGTVAHYHADLAEISRLAGDLDGAQISARRALELTPNNPQAVHNLGS